MQKKNQYDLNKRRALIRKQSESNKEIKQNERRQKRENLVEDDINLCYFFESATANKKYVDRINKHETKNEFLFVYTIDFELIESMSIGEIEQKTNIRSKNIDDFETYIIAIGVGYDSEDVIYTEWLYIIENTWI